MKNKDLEPTKDKLRVGDRIFYYDGNTTWTIEEVVEVDKKNSSAILTNNAHISRTPNHQGQFKKLNPTKSILPVRDNLCIMKLNPDLEKLHKAVLSVRKINNYIFSIEQDVLKRADLRNYLRWSPSLQDEIINICGHIAKAMEDIPLTEEEIETLDKSLDIVKPKKKKK